MMEVRLVAHTFMDGDFVADPYVWQPQGTDTKEADELGEIAGRLCYKSWSRPNPATATNEGYLRNIIDQGHLSVLEHASATFWISGVSRSLTHELVRHRHLSFSQVSQRYVDESDAGLVYHPALTDLKDREVVGDVMEMARQGYEILVESLVAKGLDRKTARGAARSVLPNATETSLIVTGNHRTWRELIAKRQSPGADAEIRQLASGLLVHLKMIAPNTYQDMDV